MIKNLLKFTNPLRRNQTKLYISLPWLMFFNIFSYVLGYYYIKNNDWLLLSFLLALSINLIGLIFKESRLICILIIAVILSANYNYLKLKLIPPKLANENLGIELIGEVTKIENAKIYLANITIIGTLKKYPFAEITIEFDKADSFLTKKFIINNEYNFKNLLLINKKYSQLNFKFLQDSEFLNLTGLHKKFHTSSLANYLLAKMQIYLEGDAKDIIATMVLGKKGSISDKVQKKFTTSGVYHLLSISALHLVQIFLFCRILMTPLLGLLAGLLNFGVLKRYKNSISFYYLAHMLAVGVCAYYVSLIDYPLPATRALIFLVFWLVSEIYLPYIPAVIRFMVITSFMVSFNPLVIGSISFWLSFIATFALILIYNFLTNVILIRQNWLFKIKIYFLMLLASSFVIGVFSFPLVILYFQQINLLQPFSNLVHIPFVSLVLIPFAFIMIPLLSISYLTKGFLDIVLKVYFDILQILVDIWLYVLDKNYNLVSFAKVNIDIKNIDVFAWSFAVFLLIISILISHQTKLAKYKAQ